MAREILAADLVSSPGRSMRMTWLRQEQNSVSRPLVRALVQRKMAVLLISAVDPEYEPVATAGDAIAARSAS